jgi:Tfp pilus assembly protein PilE
VLAAVFDAVSRAAYRHWVANVEAGAAARLEDLHQLMEEHFDQLGPALAAEWR